MTSNLREIVNGALLNQFSGKNVSIVGCILKIDSGGTAFEIRTTDDNIIKIMLQRSMSDILNVGKYVEVHGVAHGKAILGSTVIAFENMEINKEAYDKECYYLHNIDDFCKVTL